MQPSLLDEPGIITVVTREKEEINADSADLQVCVEGSSLFMGSEAFRKASEVKHLVTQLKEAGLDENQIKLRSVEINSTAVSLIKGSSAKYWLKAKSVSLELLPKVLGTIGDQKNCAMNRLEWNYSMAERVRTELRSKALGRALQIARQDASCLGVKLLGVHSVSEEEGASASRAQPLEYVDAVATKKKARAIDLNFALGNSAELKLVLRTKFKVSGFESV